MKRLPEAIAAVAADLIAAAGYPGSNVLLEAVARISERQRRYARDILMDELKQGRTLIENVEEVDELAAITLGYIHSAAGGSARLNLRLMAMVIAGLAQRKTLVSSRFLYYASFFSSLSREEIISASTLCRNEQKATKTILPEKAALAKARVWTREELVPSFFTTELHLNTACRRHGRHAQSAPANGLIASAPAPTLGPLACA